MKPLDPAVGLVGVSSPVWFDIVHTGVQHFMFFGGAILIAIRIFISAREAWKNR